MSVTVIGLGNIGSGVAKNLVLSGRKVCVYDLDSDKVAALVDLGATSAPSPPAAVAGADAVFTSLPGPAQIAAVGAEIIPAMDPGTTWVELSTNDLDTLAAIGSQADQAGIGLIDAPVSGGPEGAQAGSLSIFVGGAKADVAAVAALLDVVGNKVDHLGPRGAGTVAKIAQVTLCYTQTITLIEALLLGAKGGVAPAKMLDLIQNSAGTSYCATSYGPEILAGTYDESFPLSHAAKDLRLAMEMAQVVGAQLPLTAAVAELYERSEREYGSQAAHCLAAQLIERANDMILHQHQTATDTAER